MESNEEFETTASFENADLEELAARVKGFLDIQDRKYGFSAKLYESCFVGSEAVRQFMKNGIAADEEDAMRIGNMMLSAGLFHHVEYAHSFKNDFLFYRFASDADHGKTAKKPDGSSVSWADFMAPLTTSGGDKAISLQPDIPDRDPDLGEFAQVELEAIGVKPLDAHNTRLLDNVHPREWLDPEPKDIYNLVVLGAGRSARA